MSLLVLFGAGASYGSRDCTPYNPPLGAKLFLELEKLNGYCASLPDRIKEIFRRDFELGMEQILTERDVDKPKILREMMAYFSQFYPGDDNLYVYLLSELHRSRLSFACASLNYEMVLELAIKRCGFNLSYGKPPQISMMPSVSVLKIHGSCNFVQNFLGIKFANNVFQDCGVNMDGFPLELLNIRQVRPWLESTDHSVAPVMSMYAKGKGTPYGQSIVKKIQEMYAEVCGRSKYIFVVGTALNEHDTHIWEPIIKSGAHVYFICGEPKQVTDWIKKKHLKGGWVGKYFDKQNIDKIIQIANRN